MRKQFRTPDHYRPIAKPFLMSTEGTIKPTLLSRKEPFVKISLKRRGGTKRLTKIINVRLGTSFDSHASPSPPKIPLTPHSTNCHKGPELKRGLVKRTRNELEYSFIERKGILHLESLLKVLESKDFYIANRNCVKPGQQPQRPYLQPSSPIPPIFSPFSIPRFTTPFSKIPSINSD
jgi:hypothetical protein